MKSREVEQILPNIAHNGKAMEAILLSVRKDAIAATRVSNDEFIQPEHGITGLVISEDQKSCAGLKAILSLDSGDALLLMNLAVSSALPKELTQGKNLLAKIQRIMRNLNMCKRELDETEQLLMSDIQENSSPKSVRRRKVNDMLGLFEVVEIAALYGAFDEFTMTTSWSIGDVCACAYERIVALSKLDRSAASKATKKKAKRLLSRVEQEFYLQVNPFTQRMRTLLDDINRAFRDIFGVDVYAYIDKGYISEGDGSDSSSSAVDVSDLDTLGYGDDSNEYAIRTDDEEATSHKRVRVVDQQDDAMTKKPRRTIKLVDKYEHRKERRDQVAQKNAMDKQSRHGWRREGEREGAWLKDNRNRDDDDEKLDDRSDASSIHSSTAPAENQGDSDEGIVSRCHCVHEEGREKGMKDRERKKPRHELQPHQYSSEARCKDEESASLFETDMRESDTQEEYYEDEDENNDEDSDDDVVTFLRYGNKNAYWKALSIRSYLERKNRGGGGLDDDNGKALDDARVENNNVSDWRSSIGREGEDISDGEWAAAAAAVKSRRRMTGVSSDNNNIDAVDAVVFDRMAQTLVSSLVHNMRTGTTEPLPLREFDFRDSEGDGNCDPCESTAEGALESCMSRWEKILLSVSDDMGVTVADVAVQSVCSDFYKVVTTITAAAAKTTTTTIADQVENHFDRAIEAVQSFFQVFKTRISAAAISGGNLMISLLRFCLCDLEPALAHAVLSPHAVEHELDINSIDIDPQLSLASVFTLLRRESRVGVTGSISIKLSPVQSVRLLLFFAFYEIKTTFLAYMIDFITTRRKTWASALTASTCAANKSNAERQLAICGISEAACRVSLDSLWELLVHLCFVSPLMLPCALDHLAHNHFDHQRSSTYPPLPPRRKSGINENIFSSVFYDGSLRDDERLLRRKFRDRLLTIFGPDRYAAETYTLPQFVPVIFSHLWATSARLSAEMPSLPSADKKFLANDFVQTSSFEAAPWPTVNRKLTDTLSDICLSGGGLESYAPRPSVKHGEILRCYGLCTATAVLSTGDGVNVAIKRLQEELAGLDSDAKAVTAMRIALLQDAAPLDGVCVTLTMCTFVLHTYCLLWKHRNPHAAFTDRAGMFVVDKGVKIENWRYLLSDLNSLVHIRKRTDRSSNTSPSSLTLALQQLAYLPVLSLLWEYSEKGCEAFMMTVSLVLRELFPAAKDHAPGVSALLGFDSTTAAVAASSSQQTSRPQQQSEQVSSSLLNTFAAALGTYRLSRDCVTTGRAYEEAEAAIHGTMQLAVARFFASTKLTFDDSGGCVDAFSGETNSRVEEDGAASTLLPFLIKKNKTPKLDKFVPFLFDVNAGASKSVVQSYIDILDRNEGDSIYSGEYRKTAAGLVAFYFDSLVRNIISRDPSYGRPDSANYLNLISVLRPGGTRQDLSKSYLDHKCMGSGYVMALLAAVVVRHFGIAPLQARDSVDRDSNVLTRVNRLVHEVLKGQSRSSTDTSSQRSTLAPEEESWLLWLLIAVSFTTPAQPYTTVAEQSSQCLNVQATAPRPHSELMMLVDIEASLLRRHIIGPHVSSIGGLHVPLVLSERAHQLGILALTAAVTLLEYDRTSSHSGIRTVAAPGSCGHHDDRLFRLVGSVFVIVKAVLTAPPLSYASSSAALTTLVTFFCYAWRRLKEEAFLIASPHTASAEVTERAAIFCGPLDATVLSMLPYKIGAEPSPMQLLVSLHIKPLLSAHRSAAVSTSYYVTLFSFRDYKATTQGQRSEGKSKRDLQLAASALDSLRSFTHQIAGSGAASNYTHVHNISADVLRRHSSVLVLVDALTDVVLCAICHYFTASKLNPIQPQSQSSSMPELVLKSVYKLFADPMIVAGAAGVMASQGAIQLRGHHHNLPSEWLKCRFWAHLLSQTLGLMYVKGAEEAVVDIGRRRFTCGLLSAYVCDMNITWITCTASHTVLPTLSTDIDLRTFDKGLAQLSELLNEDHNNNSSAFNFTQATTPPATLLFSQLNEVFRAAKFRTNYTRDADLFSSRYSLQCYLDCLPLLTAFVQRLNSNISSALAFVDPIGRSVNLCEAILSALQCHIENVYTAREAEVTASLCQSHSERGLGRQDQKEFLTIELFHAQSMLLALLAHPHSPFGIKETKEGIIAVMKRHIADDATTRAQQSMLANIQALTTSSIRALPVSSMFQSSESQFLRQFLSHLPLFIRCYCAKGVSYGLQSSDSLIWQPLLRLLVNSWVAHCSTAHPAATNWPIVGSVRDDAVAMMTAWALALTLPYAVLITTSPNRLRDIHITNAGMHVGYFHSMNEATRNCFSKLSELQGATTEEETSSSDGMRNSIEAADVRLRKFREYLCVNDDVWNKMEEVKADGRRGERIVVHFVRVTLIIMCAHSLSQLHEAKGILITQAAGLSIDEKYALMLSGVFGCIQVLNAFFGNVPFALANDKEKDALTLKDFVLQRLNILLLFAQCSKAAFQFSPNSITQDNGTDRMFSTTASTSAISNLAAESSEEVLLPLVEAWKRVQVVVKRVCTLVGSDPLARLRGPKAGTGNDEKSDIATAAASTSPLSWDAKVDVVYPSIAGMCDSVRDFITSLPSCVKFPAAKVSCGRCLLCVRSGLMSIVIEQLELANKKVDALESRELVVRAFLGNHKYLYQPHQTVVATDVSTNVNLVQAKKLAKNIYQLIL